MESINNVCPIGILIEVNEDLSYMNSKPIGIPDYCKHNKSEEKQNDKENALFNLNCPTAVLIDVSSPSDFFSKDKVCSSLDVNNYSEEDSFDHSRKLDESPTQRQHWKTPSPKSMSRISKEASKVVHTLNSSEIFDDDYPLTEEMLPVPINFNIFDLEDSTEEEAISGMENAKEKLKESKKEVLKSSVSVQTQNIVIDDKIIEVDDQTHLPDSENLFGCKKILLECKDICSSIETSFSKKSLECSKELNNSKELFSLQVNDGSLNNSEVSATSDETDDVFIAKQTPSEDKENIQRREHLVLSEDLKVKSPSFKVPFKSKTKLEIRGTFRNLSNVAHEITISTPCTLPNTKKSATTPCRKLSVVKPKIIQPSTPKEQIQSQNTKKLFSSLQKPCTTTKSVSSYDSLSKSSSSELKQLTPFTKLKTPSRRYSVATPLKSASAMKPPMTPLHNFHSPSRYTPQPVRNSHISFSKSWQHSPGVSQFSNSKSMKHQNYTFESTSTNKMSSGRLSGQRRQSFSQSMSAVSFKSLGKSGLCSGKLNLPSSLPVGQDRKLARVLFPGAAKK